MVLKIGLLFGSLFRFQYDITTVKEAFCCCFGVCYQPVSLPCHLVPRFQTPLVKRRVSVVSKYYILSKLRLLVDLWTRTPDCWSCKNSSTWVLSDPSDGNMIESLTFVLQKPISWKIRSNRKWVMCLICQLAATLPFLDHRMVLPLLPIEQPEAECREKIYPIGNSLFSYCITCLTSFTSP